MMVENDTPVMRMESSVQEQKRDRNVGLVPDPNPIPAISDVLEELVDPFDFVSDALSMIAHFGGDLFSHTVHLAGSIGEVAGGILENVGDICGSVLEGLGSIDIDL